MNHTLALTALVVVGVVLAPFLPVRAIASRVLRRRRRGQHLLIVGGSPLARMVIDEVERRPDLRHTAVDVVDDAENLTRVIEAARPDRIVVALTERRGRLPLYRLVESLARGIVVEDVTESYERLTGKLALEALWPSTVIFSRDFRASRIHGALARVLSLAISFIGLIVLAPVLGLVAVLIVLDSGRPVFFVQKRVGQFGRVFTLIKFRTMRPASQPNSEWEQDNRDRITRLGRSLRRFRLDELPQLINVLRGDMNLVGPRPHPVTSVEMLILAARNLNEISGDAIPYYSLRCSVRPGMTGWAQVRYKYANSLEEEMEKIRYDLYYVKHQSLWLDLRIIFTTVKAIVRGRMESAPDVRPVRTQGREAVLSEPPASTQVDGAAAALANVGSPER
jgi:lipopolysaccharide/colanic/teichoic acid biosynthesis glycosyltransferase